MKDIKKRTITAFVIVVCLIPVVFFGGIVLDIVCGILTMIAGYELERMFKKDEKWSFVQISHIIISLITYVFLITYLSICAYTRTRALILIYILVLFLYIGFVSIFDKKTTVENLGTGFVTFFYPSIGFASLAYIRNVEIDHINLLSNYSNGRYEGLLLFCYMALICMMTDMFAYFFGCKFGKHRLCERISPKKSWEGSIAGTIFAIVIGTAFSVLTPLSEFLLPNIENFIVRIIIMVFISLLLSVVDEIGDLFASKLKRNYGIKDYSQIFPGHGGVLDRFDSYIFVSTAITLFLLII